MYVYIDPVLVVLGIVFVVCCAFLAANLWLDNRELEQMAATLKEQLNTERQSTEAAEANLARYKSYWESTWKRWRQAEDLLRRKMGELADSKQKLKASWSTITFLNRRLKQLADISQPSEASKPTLASYAQAIVDQIDNAESP